MPNLLWGHPDLSAASSRQTSWLWQGYIAQGQITLLTSQWKSGKTTLLSVLLARMKTGGDLAGSRVSPARAVIVSEESPDHWLRRAANLDLTDHVGWFCRPFTARPSHAEWIDLIDRLAALYSERSVRLVAIDPLASFIPAASENDSAGMLTALLPLQRLVSLGMALLLIHHPKKGEVTSGQAARGSGALPSFADILIEMSILGKPGDQNRKRQLHAFSRDPETPCERVIELTADGRDYINCGTFTQFEFANHWPSLQSVLENALHKLTRKEIRRAWPRRPPPHAITIGRWLDHALENGLIHRDGKGKRAHPFRYWLPSRIEAWRNDPLSRLLMPELFEQGTDTFSAALPTTVLPPESTKQTDSRGKGVCPPTPGPSPDPRPP